ncbi:MAG: protein kinase [Acidobacteriota bacterium]
MTSKNLFGFLGDRDYEEKARIFHERGNWQKAAEYYRRAEKWDLAAQVYLEHDQLDLAVAVFREGTLLDRAAELYELHARLAAQPAEAERYWRRAVQLWTDIGLPARAAKAYLTIDQPVRAGRLFEQAGEFQQAADCYVRVGETTYALRALEKESERLAASSEPTAVDDRRRIDRQRAEMLANLERHLDAARLFASLGAWGEAARGYERALHWGEAARAWLEAAELGRARHALGNTRSGEVDDALRAELFAQCGEHAEAARIWLTAGHPDRAKEALEQAATGELADTLRAEIFAQTGEHASAARLYEELDRFDEAAASYEEAGEGGKAASMWERAKVFDRAAALYERIGRDQEAGECWARADRHLLAGDAFARAGSHLAAANAFYAAAPTGLYRAGRHYLEAGQTEAARGALAEIAEDDPDWAHAAVALLEIHLTEGDHAAASRQLEALESSPAASGLREAESLYWQGRIHEARGDDKLAETSYRRVLEDDDGFRDAGERLWAVRQRLSLPTSPETVAAPAEPPVLPFEIERELSAWWPDTRLERAIDYRSQRPVSLLSMPTAEITSVLPSWRPHLSRLTGLDHPSILTLYEAIEAADELKLAYQSFDGATLADRLRSGSGPAPLPALNVLRQVCEGLVAANAVGVNHLWLSPRTILVDPGHRTKISGLGLHDLEQARGGIDPAYQAPEQKAGQPAGAGADAFAVGLIGLVLLGARITEPELLPDSEAVRWPIPVTDSVPTLVRDTLVRCLAPRPFDRPAFEEIRTALASLGLVPGQILEGRYQILGELGKGGMSRVYRALDRELEEEVAIKTLLSLTGGNDEDYDRMLRELKICRKISHPNVVRVHDRGRYAGGIFIVMELLEGPGLDFVIRAEAPLSTSRTQRILRQIASALIEAHHLKIVHRDLKPSNVMLVDGRVKVMDFGIARMDDANNPEITRKGEVFGSPLYMSPEQIQGHDLDGRSDLYALGVIAFTMLTGREPFLGKDANEVVQKHLVKPAPDVRSFRAELPVEWARFVDRLLAKKVDDRPADAAAVVELLDGLGS